MESPAYADLQHEFDVLGGYTLDQRVEEALSGLGFDATDWDRPPTALSGGEQTRAALARLVIADPDLLLLDEPTNHLDIGALEWLEEHLRRRRGSLLVASHDRAFLDATVTRVWELRDRRLTAVPRRLLGLPPPARGARRASRQGRRDPRRVDRARAGARPALPHRIASSARCTSTRRASSGSSRIGSRRPKSGRKLTLPGGALAGGGPARSGEVVVRVEDLVVGYLPGRGATLADGSPSTEPRPVARIPFLAAQRGERIGIVGPNGAGKTTLLRTIAGDLPPIDGRLTFGNAVQIGYLAQLRGAAIPGATVLDALLEAIPLTPGEARAYLARFLFRGDDAFKEVRSLSGGERSRLELALLGIMPSNLLLLDEPTNHLDIPAREAIESFMLESPATLLVVSHDRRLLETICTRLWVVGDGARGRVRRRLPRVAGGGRRAAGRWRRRRRGRRPLGDRRGRAAAGRGRGPAGRARRATRGAAASGCEAGRRSRPVASGCRRTRTGASARRSTRS